MTITATPDATSTTTPTAGPAPATAGPVQSSNAAHTVPTRRISFEEVVATVPKHFAEHGDLINSHVVAALTSVFPDGEDYFVRSVRRFRDQITDPVLKRQVNGFIGQESVHGREHRVFNERLDDLGYGTKRAERVTRAVLRGRERITSAKSNLAVTAALEHFTATLAELLLRDEEFRRSAGHQAVQDLFVWHALEEAEHKAVAFDVYRAVGGSERMRIGSMKVIRKGFIAAMIFQVTLSVLMDPATYRRGNLRTSLRRFKTSPFLRKELREQLRAYDRVGFHPDDIDTDDLVAEWREKLFGDEGSLNVLLASAA